MLYATISDLTFQLLYSSTGFKVSLFFYCYRLRDHEDHGSRSFFTEIISAISDIKFARDGVHILSRDYMSLKVFFFC